MEFDLFASPSRWAILEIIAEKPSSPLEISQRLRVSVSFVSQQLKLLEVAGIVGKEKTGATEKGKPRTVYSVRDEAVYFNVLARGFASRKLIYLTDYHKMVLRVWMIDDVGVHHIIGIFLSSISEVLHEIDGIFYKKNSRGKPEVLVVSSSKEVKGILERDKKRFDKKLSFSVADTEAFLRKKPEEFFPIHDPNLMLGKKEVKGG